MGLECGLGVPSLPSLPPGSQVTVLLRGRVGTCLGLIDRRPLGIPPRPPVSGRPITQGGNGLRTYLENVFIVAFKNLPSN